MTAVLRAAPGAARLGSALSQAPAMESCHAEGKQWRRERWSIVNATCKDLVGRFSIGRRCICQLDDVPRQLGAKSQSSQVCTLLTSDSAATCRHSARVVRAEAKGGRRGDTMSPKSLEATVEMDRLIDELRSTETQKLAQKIAENILSFDEAFWLRLAYRSDACQSVDDRRDFEELASIVMTVVERLVQKTEEKMSDSSTILEKIVSSAAEPNGDFIVPMTKASISRLRQALDESSHLVDESILSHVSAWMRKLEKVSESERRLLPILQRFYQLYAARELTSKNSKLLPKRIRADDDGEKLLATIIPADEEEWEPLLSTGLVYNPNMIVKRFFDAILRRKDRVTFQLESGSYAQRIVSEYLAEIEDRARGLIQASKESPNAPSIDPPKLD